MSFARLPVYFPLAPFMSVLEETISHTEFFAEGKVKGSRAARPALQMAAVLKGSRYGGAVCRRRYIAFYGRGIVYGDRTWLVPRGVKRIDVLAGCPG